MTSTPQKTEKRIPTPHSGRVDVEGIIQAFAHRMTYTVARDEHTASDYDVYEALAYAVRDRLMDRWFATRKAYYRSDAKRVYYLSLEFLMGRALLNNILNLEAREPYTRALAEIGYSLEEIQEREADAGLGNGGLGRLAACFLDSAATLGIPLYGYGIRYEYGIFRQRIVDGVQIEAPDNWLRYGNPWEVARPDVFFPVRFGGRVQQYRGADGEIRVEWVDTQDIYAMAYDMPVVGYGNNIVNTLRLWAAKSSRAFDLASFNAGDYVRAVEDKTNSENISKVLYPVDDQSAGKELRLKQQYFFVSASLQDILRRFNKVPNREWERFPEAAAIQLNDTHPAIAIPELMRLLVDQENLDWETAWGITERVFGYTNHTILPEALEVWPVEFLSRILPRHFQIIEEIDRRLRSQVQARFPGDGERQRRMAIVSEEPQRVVRMAHLAIAGSHAVNGVARLHSEILRNTVFRDFHELYPGRFTNITNGITPRRWLMKANPRLAALITRAIGPRWIEDLSELRKLEAFAADSSFCQQWSDVKQGNKADLAQWVRHVHRIEIDPATLFDVQVKRIHEYKRQLLNALHVISLVHQIRDGGAQRVPRTVIFAGKAAPSYVMAKLIIKLIHSIGQMIEDLPDVRSQLRVAFLPNYGVSCAERIFPGCDLSEQISTAGTEASGTGNMKAALNGALTIGTLDGANVEMLEQVGAENIFIFGHTAADIEQMRRLGYSPDAHAEENAELRRVIKALASPELERGHPGIFRPIIDSLLNRDRYFHCADFASYAATQRRVEELYRHPIEWTAMSIRNVAGMGMFSSDRTMRQYAEEIWSTSPVKVAFHEGSCVI